jgi:hypothetical protein
MVVDGRIILKWIMWKQGGSMWTGSIWLGQGPVAGCCEHSISGSVWLPELLSACQKGKLCRVLAE